MLFQPRPDLETKRHYLMRRHIENHTLFYNLFSSTLKSSCSIVYDQLSHQTLSSILSYVDPQYACFLSVDHPEDSGNLTEERSRR